MQPPMGDFRANDGSFYDLMRLIQGDFRTPTRATRTSIGQQGHRCGRLQEHLLMARMARLGPKLTSLGSLRPSLAFHRGEIGRRRSTGVRGVLVSTSFKGIDPLQEGEALTLHARWGLLPIFSWDAESFRKGDRSQQVAHDGLSSCLVSPSLPQSGLGVSHNGKEWNQPHTASPVINYGTQTGGRRVRRRALRLRRLMHMLASLNF